MFAFLFGKKSKQVAGAVPASPLQTIHHISQHEADLEKKITQLEAIQASHHTQALHFKQCNREATALQFLKREKLVEEELTTTRGMLLKLIQQRAILEQTLINTDTMNALQRATTVVQAQQKVWSAEKVATLSDDMYEVSDTAREISDLIQGMGPRQDVSDAELLRELDMEVGMTSVAAPASSTELPSAHMPELPTIPITPTNTQQQQQLPSPVLL
jgi:hypothetical protein